MTIRRASNRGHPEVGSFTIEFMIVMPLVLVIIGLMYAFARTQLAQGSVQAAAAEAARTASIARSAVHAQAVAATAAAESLRRQDVDCGSTSVDVDTGGFAAAPGTASAVSTTVTCVVQLSDLAVPGLPGSKVISATSTSPLDIYRERR